MNNRGSITIFAALILVSLMILMSALVESSRIISSKSISEEITDVSVQSSFSKYAKEVFEEYGVFCLAESAKILKKDCKYYINETLRNGKDIYGINLNQCNVNNTTYITDGDGDYFYKQVEKLMNYKITEDIIEQIITMLSGAEVDSGLKKVMDAVAACEDFLVNLEDSVRRVKSYVSVIKRDISELEICVDEYNSYIENLSRISKKNKKREEYINCLLEKKYNLENYCDELESYFSKIDSENNIYKSQSKSICDGADAAGKQIDEQELYKEEMQEIKNDLQQIKSNLLDNDVYKVEYVVKENESLSLYLTNMRKQIAELDKAVEDNKYDKLLIINKLENNMSRYKININDQSTVQGNSIISSAKNIISGNIIKLVISDTSNLSKKKIDDSVLPSSVCEYSTSHTYSSKRMSAKNVKYSQYIMDYFTSYTSENSKKKNKPLSCEIEYIICGKKSDYKNMEEIINKLIAIREGFNLLHIFTDSNKKLEALAMAESIVGLTGITPLVTVTKYAIMVVWATAESITDVRNLLEGGKVPLIKTRANWNTTLSRLGDESEYSNYKSNRIGLKYEDYLRVLILKQNKVKQVYRTLDIIQLNMSNKYDDSFALNECICGADIKAKFDVEKLFNIGINPSIYSVSANIEFMY